MADSQTDAGRHQLYNNGSLVLFSTACTEHVHSPICIFEAKYSKVLLL